MNDSNRLESLIDPAVKTLGRILTDNEHEENEFAQAQIAKSVLATWAKLKQSDSAKEAVYFTMARELSQNPEQLAEYIRITLPGVPIVKMIEDRKGGTKKT